MWLVVCMVVAACDLGHHDARDAGPIDPENGPPACSTPCHGSNGEAAPPRDTSGRSDPGSIGNGAHRSHLAKSDWRKRVDCVACHTVPTQIGAPGHIDTPLPAEVIFTGLADGAAWNRDTQTCTNSYCHGATLTNSVGSATGMIGGTATEPMWTLLDGSQKQCDSCHGNPPPAPHPQDADCGLCHPTMNPGESPKIAYPELHIDGHVDVVNTAACDSCHGANGQPAPPKDTTGNTATTARGVGAHAAHLTTSSSWHATINCTECHKVPAGVNDQGHIDTPSPAELVWGPLAGATAQWNGTTCTNTYCHGSATGPLVGGTATAPIWTKVDGTQSQCGSCHGAPPPPPHPVDTNCGSCHPTMNPGGGLVIAYPALHIDGKVDITQDQPCDACHGSGGNAAPPRDTTGGTTTDRVGVGAHRNHLDPSTWRKTITCDECHRVPTAVFQIGHIDSPRPAELAFGVLAGGATWNGATCTNTYCHGATLTGGTSINPVWTVVNGQQGQCGSCHGTPPPPPHPVDPDCGTCHNTMTPGMGLVITDPTRHIDGNVDVNSDQPCNTCHGSLTGNAPPKDTTGHTATNTRGVGAHQAHLATTTRFLPVACDDCHRVPGSVTSVGHLDTPLPAELTFSARAGTTTAWNGSRCSNTYCHGATLTSGTGGAGGTATSPIWTTVDGSQAQCTSCHGNPPPAPHPQVSDCGLCHGDVMAGSPTVFSDPLKHVDGTVDVSSSGQACNACHGSATNSAPPKDTTGHTATTTRGVGAHQAHLATTSTWHTLITCDQCHQVPPTVDAPGHIDTAAPAELIFAGLAIGSTWNGTTCTSYCHGSTLAAGGTATSPLWTKVDGTQSQCTSCHGAPPPPPHPTTTDCGLCHNTMTAGGGLVITDPTRHIDGTVDVNLNQACNSCHGSATSNAPPKDTSGNTATTVRGVGAHQAHVATGSTTHRDIPCGECHQVPSTVDAVGHIDSPLPAELSFTDVATGSTWNGATCTSYCHGSTLAAGGNATTPMWTKVDGTQKQCTSCHGNPPPAPHPANAADCGTCHNDVVPGSPTTFSDCTRHVDGNVDVTTTQPCNFCHGSVTNNAPPKDTLGNLTTTTRGVGAHQSHLVPTNQFRPVSCNDCHLVPATLNATGHIDTALPAELTFSTKAGAATWNGTSCAASYCHGNTLGGGTAKTPVWTTVNGSQAQCGSCHGNPPPAPHPQLTNCGQCHNDVVVGSPTTFSDASRHVDTNLDVTTNLACNACHGSVTNNAPPKDTAGNTATTARGVGAHQAHLATTNRFKVVLCADCHKVPATFNAPGHIDTALPAELTFSARSGVTTTWNGTTCANNYCHGATLAAGGLVTAPVWTTVNGSQAQCTSCHGNPPPAPHPAATNCGQCHDDVVVGSPTTFSAPTRHVDGNLDVTTTQACNACHGSTTNDAPPKDTAGNTATTTRGVGAHQAHLVTTSTTHKLVTCGQCHTVPTALASVGHVDTPLPAELKFTGLAAGSTWNGSTCTSYCHGSTLAAGGATTTPLWTKVDGTQKQCTSCHGNPPPAPHPQNTACQSCHPNAGANGTFTTPAQHVDGTLQVTMVHPIGYNAREMHGYDFDKLGSSTCATAACHGTALTGGTGGPSCNSCHTGWQTNCALCHGTTANGAPPQGVLGQTAPTDKHVGAHTEHVTATTNHAAFACSACHTNPSSALTPGHIDGTGSVVAAEVRYSTLNPSGTYTTTTATCANLYCHGNGRTSAGTSTWTSTTALTCTSCHLTTTIASGRHNTHINGEGMKCNECHQTVVNSTFGIIGPALHVNGLKDVKMPTGTWTSSTKSCSGLPGGCHGTKTWQ